LTVAIASLGKHDNVNLEVNCPGLSMDWSFTRLIGFCAFAGAGLILPGLALASEIKAYPPKKADDATFIVIDGEIKSGDDDKFRKIAAEYSDAIVLLNSEGGMIGPAMDIGRTIKLRGYKTTIYKNGSCASACALIWLAGAKRVLFEGGQVGFHASYLDTDGTKLETGVGNALVGHYLSQLGFGEKTVVFATLAPPDKIFWLNEQTAKMSGIEFDTIPDDEKVQKPEVAATQPAPPPVIVAPAPQQRRLVGEASDFGHFMGDAKQTLRSPEAFAQALRQQGYQAKVTYELKGIPMIAVSVGGEEIGVGFSECSGSGCQYIQIIDWFTDITEDEAYFLAGSVLRNEGYSHPFWNKENKSFALYNYIVIGEDGITVKNLIDNMKYFVRENYKLSNLILDRRSRKQN
jgi:hypothetical protein